jgi:hypothetical protein
MSNITFKFDFSPQNIRNNNQLINTVDGLNTLTLYNNPKFSEGFSPKTPCINFIASANQYAMVKEFSTGSTGMTFACWFKSDPSNGTWSRIFDFGNGAGRQNIIIFINSGFLGLSVYSSKGNYQINNIVPNVNTNTWFHVAWTLTNPTGWNLYINGSLFTTYKDGHYPDIGILRKYQYIAKSNWADPMFTGSIADFRIYYHNVLNANQVSTIYQEAFGDNFDMSNSKLEYNTNDQLYSFIFSDLFKTNDGYNKCNSCSFKFDEPPFTSTQKTDGEYGCMKTCSDDKTCTSYSYNTLTTDCNKYSSSFPSNTYTNVPNINSGYNLNYQYDYNKLNTNQKNNVKSKTASKFLNSTFIPNKIVDLEKCLNIQSSNSISNFNTNAECVYNIYTENNLKTNQQSMNNYEDEKKYTISKTDPIIDNRKLLFNDYIGKRVEKSNIYNTMNFNKNLNEQNKNLLNVYSNTINEDDKEFKELRNDVLNKINENNNIESFENESSSIVYNNNGKFFVLIIILIIFFILLFNIFKK